MIMVMAWGSGVYSSFTTLIQFVLYISITTYKASKVSGHRVQIRRWCIIYKARTCGKNSNILSNDWLPIQDKLSPKRRLTSRSKTSSNSQHVISINAHSDPHDPDVLLVFTINYTSGYTLACDTLVSADLSATMLFQLLLLLAAVAPYAFGDVEFTSPSAGATAVGGQLLQFAWKDSGTSPPISDLQSFQVFLCAGGNKAGSFVSTGCSWADIQTLC